jgi:hypothetical protein
MLYYFPAFIIFSFFAVVKAVGWRLIRWIEILLLSIALFPILDAFLSSPLFYIDYSLLFLKYLGMILVAFELSSLLIFLFHRDGRYSMVAMGLLLSILLLYPVEDSIFPYMTPWFNKNPLLFVSIDLFGSIIISCIISIITIGIALQIYSISPTYIKWTLGKVFAVCIAFIVILALENRCVPQIEDLMGGGPIIVSSCGGLSAFFQANYEWFGEWILIGIIPYSFILHITTLYLLACATQVIVQQISGCIKRSAK